MNNLLFNLLKRRQCDIMVLMVEIAAEWTGDGGREFPAHGEGEREVMMDIL